MTYEYCSLKTRAEANQQLQSQSTGHYISLSLELPTLVINYVPLYTVDIMAHFWSCCKPYFISYPSLI